MISVIAQVITAFYINKASEYFFSQIKKKQRGTTENWHALNVNFAGKCSCYHYPRDTRGFFFRRSFKITYNIECCPELGTAPLKPCPRYLVSSIGCHSDVMAAVPTVFSIAGSGAPGGNVCVPVLAD